MIKDIVRPNNIDNKKNEKSITWTNNRGAFLPTESLTKENFGHNSIETRYKYKRKPTSRFHKTDSKPVELYSVHSLYTDSEPENFISHPYFKGKGVGIYMSSNENKSHNRPKNNGEFRMYEIENSIKNQLKSRDYLELGDIVALTKERYNRLLIHEKAVEEAIDEIMYEVASERVEEEFDIELSDVLCELDLDIDEILELVDELEDEEDEF
ncbi:hypothetical protein ABE178_25365 [Priestia megaterium]